MRPLVWTAVLCIITLLGYNLIVVSRALMRSSEVAKESVAFNRQLNNPGQQLLVVGDSTAVGTGSAAPADSIAGRIARDFPATAVLNLAKNGALTRAVPGQLNRVNADSFDLVLVQVGGNDALRFTGRAKLEKDIDQTLSLAADKGEHTLLISVGNLGNAPALPWPLSALYSRRSQMVRDVFVEAARRHGVHYLDLIAQSGTDSPFKTQPDKYYSRDGLHPSGAGYGVWYESLIAAHPLKDWLAPDTLP